MYIISFEKLNRGKREQSEERCQETQEQEGRTQMQNFKFNKGLFQKSKSQQSRKKIETRKCTRKLTKLNYAKTREET